MNEAQPDGESFAHLNELQKSLIEEDGWSPPDSDSAMAIKAEWKRRFGKEIPSKVHVISCDGYGDQAIAQFKQQFAAIVDARRRREEGTEKEAD